MREFPFELAMCAHLEATTDAVVGRQIGGGVHAPANRIVDVLLVEPGPEFDDRTRLTSATIPDVCIESDVGVGRARYWKDCFERPTAHAERAVERAVEIGFFERERRNGRDYVRQAARYPDWFGKLVGIENKPDLSRPGDLTTQLRKDASLGLLDEVVLATESYVTRAHLNRIPAEVGVWRVDTDAPAAERIEVVREATPLDPGATGIELLEEHPLRTDVRAASAAAKARRRRRMAERAYGKGWRTYEFPACAEIEPGSFAGGGALPYCAYKDRLVDPANCGASCPGHDPAEPPAVSISDERAARTAWEPDPAGAARRQSGLDRFR